MKKFCYSLLGLLLLLCSPIVRAGGMPPQCCWMIGRCCNPPMPLPPKAPWFIAFDNRDVMHPQF